LGKSKNRLAITSDDKAVCFANGGTHRFFMG
jgi:hypothetical protein